jgi:hypothetical protein
MSQSVAIDISRQIVNGEVQAHDARNLAGTRAYAVITPDVMADMPSVGK